MKLTGKNAHSHTSQGSDHRLVSFITMRAMMLTMIPIFAAHIEARRRARVLCLMAMLSITNFERYFVDCKVRGNDVDDVDRLIIEVEGLVRVCD